MDSHVRSCAVQYYRELSREGRKTGACAMKLPEGLLGKRVVDLLCRKGKGAYCISDETGDRGFVLGIDPDESSILVARRKAAENHWSGQAWERYLRFACAFPEDLSAAGVFDASFDVAYVNSAINTVFDISLTLAEVARCLKPDGYLWVSQGVFRSGSGECSLHEGEDACAGNVFARALSVERFRELCLRAGFRSVEVVDVAPVQPDGADAQELHGSGAFVSANVRANL